MKLKSKEYRYHITEKDIIEWIEKEHQLKVKRLVQVDGVFGDSDYPETKEEDKYILVIVEIEDSPDNHAPDEIGGTDEASEGQAMGYRDGKKLNIKLASWAEEGES